jgi:hypothetical protein
MQGGIEHWALCRLFEGRYIQIEVLVRDYLTGRGQPVGPDLAPETLKDFRQHILNEVKEWELERLPLRPGVALLTPQARVALEAQKLAVR